jgi:hypothetical protein
MNNRALELGIGIGGEQVWILFYADDVGLLADNKEEFQAMLHALSDWCT